MKKVIFIMVDSLIPSVLEQCFQSRTVPALQFLRDKGQYRPDCVTVFPTMTASVDSSLLTGAYPNIHKVPSLIWYDPEQKEVINYINGTKCVWKLGIQNCARNVLIHLNEKHLSHEVKTIFEELSEQGLTSASINMIIHRGARKHDLQLPLLLKWTSRIKKNQTIHGPDILTIGAISYSASLKKHVKNFSTGIRQLWGINDNFAMAVTNQLIEDGQQPDFMMVYLPDNDHTVHKKSPEHGELALIQADRQIQKLLESFESWEKALEQNTIIVTSDHGQTRVGKEEDFNINLDHLFKEFHALPLGKKVQENHQVVVCNNERMAYLYPLRKGVHETLIQSVAMESRIDLIAWKEKGKIIVLEGGTKRRLTFSPSGPYIDSYGVSWNIDGDLSVLDICLRQQMIAFNDYPDALSRLYGALFSQDCPMIVITARPRYEFKTKYHPIHNNGGSHGSLHKWDSLIPLFVAGAERESPLPSRLVDLKEYVLQLYNSSPF